MDPMDAGDRLLEHRCARQAGWLFCPTEIYLLCRADGDNFRQKPNTVFFPWSIFTGQGGNFEEVEIGDRSVFAIPTI